MPELQYKLSLHETQWGLFDDPHRFRVTVNGRRWGKTMAVINSLIMASLEFKGKMSLTSPQTVLGVLPTAVQARPILFKPLANLFEQTDLKYLLDTSKTSPINHSEMVIYLRDKPPIRVAGANDKNGDRLRGKRIWFVALDECQDILPAAFYEVIRPAMSDTPGSRCLITGTPKGKQNILYEFSQMPATDPEWSFHTYPTWTNPFIPREEVEKARLTLPPRVFEQEYEAKFTNFPGQYFPELDSNNLFHDPDNLPHLDLIVMGVDFGDLHPALSVVGRDPVEQCWYWLGGWSPNTGTGEGQPIPRDIFDKKVREFAHRYDVQLILCDPSRPSDILSIRNLGKERCFKSALQGYNKIETGIAQVANLIYLNKLKFVVTGETFDDFVDGRQAYEYHQSYHRITRNGILTDEPADGSFSHIVDSTRYALAVRGG